MSWKSDIVTVLASTHHGKWKAACPLYGGISVVCQGSTSVSGCGDTQFTRPEKVSAFVLKGALSAIVSPFCDEVLFSLIHFCVGILSIWISSQCCSNLYLSLAIRLLFLAAHLCHLSSVWLCQIRPSVQCFLLSVCLPGELSNRLWACLSARPCVRCSERQHDI